MVRADTSPSVAHDDILLDGYIFSDKTSDLPKFGDGEQILQKLPSGVDLRRVMTPIEHQGNINSWLVSIVFWIIDTFLFMCLYISS